MTWWYKLLASNTDNDIATLYSAFNSLKYAACRKLDEKFESLYNDDMPLHLALRTGMSVSIIDAILSSSKCEESCDKYGQLPLHLAIQLGLSSDIISLLVSKFPQSGMSPLCYATLSQDTNGQKIVLQLAVPFVQSILAEVEAFINERNYLGCKRMLRQVLDTTLAGIPCFDYFLLQDTDKMNPEEVCSIFRKRLREFLKKFGNLDPPVLVKDLSPSLLVCVGGKIVLAVEAVGEPLEYQWFHNDEEIPEKNTNSITVTTNAEPLVHNGQYWCVIQNWRGYVTSSRATVRVSDDDKDLDPCLDYVLRPEQLRAGEKLIHLTGSFGGLVHLPGVSVLVQPSSFRIIDWFDKDASDRVGLDLAVSVTSSNDKVNVGRYPELDSSREDYRSSFIRLRPDSIESLVFSPPIKLRLSHSAIIRSTTFNLDVMTLVKDIQKKDQWEPMKKSEFRVFSNYVEVDVSTLGHFVVVETAKRKIYGSQRGESAVVLIFGPKHVNFGELSVKLCVCVCASREDQKHFVLKDDSLLLYYEEQIQLYYRQSLSVEIEHQRKSCKINEHLEFEIPVSEVLLKSGVAYFLYRDIGLTIPPFDFDGKTLYPGIDVKTSISIPLLYPDLKTAGPVVELVSRTETSLTFKLSPSWGETRIADYSPLYHVMELAVFTEPFWNRYQDIWWFKSGESHIVNQMFKTVYQGDSEEVCVKTDAFAASIRIAACNADHIGPFGKPLILKPNSNSNEPKEDHPPSINSSIEYYQSFKGFYEAFYPLWDKEVLVKEMMELLWNNFCHVSEREWYQHLEKESFRLNTSNFVIMVMLRAVECIETLVNAAYVKGSSVSNVLLAFLPIRRLRAVFTKNYEQYRERIMSIIACEKKAIETLQTYSQRSWLSRVILDEQPNDKLDYIVHEIRSLYYHHSDTNTILSDCIIPILDSLKSNEEQKAVFCLVRQYCTYLIRAVGSASVDLSILKTYMANALCVDSVAAVEKELGLQSTKIAMGILLNGDHLKDQISDISPCQNEILSDFTMTSIIVTFKSRVCKIEQDSVVRLKDVTADTVVAGKTVVDFENQRLQFTPTDPLLPRSDYVVTIFANAFETSIGRMQTNVVVNFSTGRKKH